MSHLGMITVVVDDYDTAIDYYTEALGFTLVEDTKMSDVAAMASKEGHATPPSAANFCATSARTSNTFTTWPARRNDCAMPMPIAPKPMTPTDKRALIRLFSCNREHDFADVLRGLHECMGLCRIFQIEDLVNDGGDVAGL